MWSDPKKTGILLGVVTFLYLLFEKSGYTLISIFANTALILVLGCFVWANVAAVMGKGAPPVPKVELSEESMKSLAVSLTTGLNAAAALIYRLGTGTDIVLSAKAVGFFYVLGKFGSWFHLLTLLYLAAFVALTVPKGCECVYKKCVAALTRRFRRNTCELYRGQLTPSARIFTS